MSVSIKERTVRLINLSDTICASLTSLVNVVSWMVSKERSVMMSGWQCYRTSWQKSMLLSDRLSQA